MKFNFLTNKYVLYILFFISFINILGYFIEYNYGAVILFSLSIFIIYCFSTNMIIVLGLSIIITNLLTHISNIFYTSNKDYIKNKEGFTGKDKIEDKVEEKDIIIQEKEIDGTNNKLFTDINFEEYITSPDQNKDSTKITNQKKKEKESNVLNSDKIKKVKEEANNLANVHQKLMSDLSDFTPLFNSALQAMGNINANNIGEISTTLSNSLDKLYNLHPEYFPENYEAINNNFKNTIKLMNSNK